MGFLLLVSLSTSCGVLFLCLLGVFYSVIWKPLKLQRYLRQQGIASPPYKILYGNLKEYADAKKYAKAKPMGLSHNIAPRIAPFPNYLIKKYGKMPMFWFGVHPRVYIMDPDLIREVLSNKFGHFPKPKLNPFVKFLLPGLVGYEGEKWAKHRRVLNPAFHAEKLKRMLAELLASCDEMIHEWEKLVGPQGSSEVDVWPHFQRMAADVISRTAFGINYKEGAKTLDLLSEQAEFSIEAASIYFPGLWFIPTKKNLRRKEIEGEVRSILKDMIQKKEKAIKLGGAQPDNLLGLLIESNWKDSQERGEVAMTMDDVIQECKQFYSAGHETIATLLTWTMMALCMHPEWQTRAREEVQQIFGKRDPDFDGLSRLKTMTMILYEVLHLYPVGINLIRVTHKEVRLGDITFPAGVELALPFLFVHHDPELWGSDAEEFKPERFQGGISKATKNPAAFFPFGAGPRICIGQNFALVEAKVALSMILQRFSFELSPSYAHAPHIMRTLQPQHGVQVILRNLVPS